MNKLKYIPGDIVTIETKLTKPRVVKVSNVDVDSVIYCEGWGEVCFYDEIKPIPLTSNILEKNGWKLRHGFYWSPNGEGLVVGLSSHPDYVWEASIGEYLLCGNINSVSDLQHLLFGLGLNSEMEV